MEIRGERLNWLEVSLYQVIGPRFVAGAEWTWWDLENDNGYWEGEIAPILQRATKGAVNPQEFIEKCMAHGWKVSKVRKRLINPGLLAFCMAGGTKSK